MPTDRQTDTITPTQRGLMITYMNEAKTGFIDEEYGHDPGEDLL